jgi:hypothetical protein
MIDFTLSSNVVNALYWDFPVTLQQTGGSAILNFKIKWNQGPVLNTWQELTTVSGTQLSYI